MRQSSDTTIDRPRLIGHTAGARSGTIERKPVATGAICRSSTTLLSRLLRENSREVRLEKECFLCKQIERRDPSFNKPLVILEQQKSGSEFAMLSDAIEQTFLGLIEADNAHGLVWPSR